MARAVAVPLSRSGPKQAVHENFPVASLLLAPANRERVMAFYAFARAADDIADCPELEGTDKLARLDWFEQGLGGQTGAPQALALHQALDGDERLLAHGGALLQAFRRDALGDCCRSWSDLMAYCACSAAPVGRFLLDLHDEDERLYPRADSLCAALQVLNHLQDCGDDYRRLGRVYLPADWMDSSGLDGAILAGIDGGAALRHVADLCLDRVEMLIEQSRALPALMSDRRLRLETAIIVEIAARLAQNLRRQDPLAQRVQLSPPAYAIACCRGLFAGLRPPA